MKKLYVIGIGYKPPDERSRKILLAADSIVASARLFEVFKEHELFPALKEKVRVIRRVGDTMQFIRDNIDKYAVVLLGSGDPMFYGIGRQVLSEFGFMRVEIIPDLSSIQVAFSRIKETWDDAFLMSLHGNIDPERKNKLPYQINDVPSLLLQYGKLAILTDKKNNPAEIARHLMNAPYSASARMFVCERLGYPGKERIVKGTPQKIVGQVFSDPNVVILIANRKEKQEQASREEVGTAHTKEQAHGVPCFGLTESEIEHSRGLITKDEVRAVAIHKLRLPAGGTLWDIGSGSGSISIEAARLSHRLAVYAIEKDAEQIAHLEKNKTRFDCRNITIVEGGAPGVLKALPSPDRAFIGGSGGQLSGIVSYLARRMAKGIVVINAVTLKTLNQGIALLEKRGFAVSVSQVSVSRTSTLHGQKQLNALNQIFIISGERK
ncbi:MAG TPA: precorrin-6y C5,15-methyltransferase (decarboxylating) subunit CbiE [Syntrophorhabdales bacterium]|nr:precorrin-6y C5,15-methyltransferase (decarboxylating) subunit CbiE [Syntrophorhabdales bacterium]